MSALNDLAEAEARLTELQAQHARHVEQIHDFFDGLPDVTRNGEQVRRGLDMAFAKVTAALALARSDIRAARDA